MSEKRLEVPAMDGMKIAELRARQAMESWLPVSLVAKDWRVSPRRIRALLAAGRLAGQVQANGYWEVRYPYSFTFGTRGPGLKRQLKPERRAE